MRTALRQSLRKGLSRIYLHYDSGDGDIILADQFEALLDNHAVVIRFHIKPADDNQCIDERKLHSETLTEVHFRENHLIGNLLQFLRQPYVNAQESRLLIISKGISLNYIVKFGDAEDGDLPLFVQRIAI